MAKSSSNNLFEDILTDFFLNTTTLPNKRQLENLIIDATRILDESYCKQTDLNSEILKWFKANRDMFKNQRAKGSFVGQFGKTSLNSHQNHRILERIHFNEHTALSSVNLFYHDTNIEPSQSNTECQNNQKTINAVVENRKVVEAWDPPPKPINHLFNDYSQIIDTTDKRYFNHTKYQKLPPSKVSIAQYILNK